MPDCHAMCSRLSRARWARRSSGINRGRDWRQPVGPQRYAAPGITLIQGVVVGILEQFRSLFRREQPDIEPAPTPEPAIAARALQVNERRGKERINAREGTRVLIIDDSKTVVTVLKKFLRSAGYETRRSISMLKAG